VSPPETTSTASVASRVDAQLDGARLRILVIGAGIGGSTLAALLRQRGEQVAVLERDDGTADGGYMLGVMPLGGRVLNGLELVDAYDRASVPMRTYELFGRHGQLIRRYALGDFVEQYGDYRGIERSSLLEILRTAAGDIVYGHTVTTIEENPAAVTATFSDGSHTEVDLIVGADGIHSTTRAMIVDADDVEEFDTGWGGYILWAPLGDHPKDTYSEMWAAGWGVGVYPVPGRAGIFLAGRTDDITDRDPHEYAAEVAGRLPIGVFSDALSLVDPDEPAFMWRMADIRSSVWHTSRAVLLGDAAAGFLPTAGVGASAAMDSAAALADELSRADAAHLTYALELYERRQRHRVELAQKNSRALAKFMFVNGGPIALTRDQLMRFYTLKRMISDISKVMDGA